MYKGCKGVHGGEGSQELTLSAWSKVKVHSNCRKEVCHCVNFELGV